jgi:hypothetical protein
VCVVASPAQDPIPVEQWQSRLSDDKLSAEEIATAVAQALKLQADAAAKWDWRWGDFVALARKKGRLSDELWRDYLLGAVRPKMRVADAVKRSAGLPMWLDDDTARTGRERTPAHGTTLWEVDLSGVPAKNSWKGEANLGSGGASSMGLTEDLKQKRYADLKPGPQKLHYKCTIEIFDGPEEKKDAKSLGKRVFEATLPWALLEEEAGPVLPALRPDPALRAAIEKSFGTPLLLRDDRDQTFVQVMLQVDRPPAGMGFDLALRAEGHTWALGPVAWTKGNIGWWAFDTDLPENIGQVDVVLTPSVQAAGTRIKSDPYRLMNLTEIWDGPEIVVHAPVRHQRVEMQRIAPLTPEAAREYALAQLDPADPVTARLKRDGDFAAARTALEGRCKEHPEDAAAQYALGCLLTAEGEPVRAMRHFAEARKLAPADDLQRKIQHELRRLCAMWLKRAEAGEPPAMLGLGAAYEHGLGVAAVLPEAKRWYRQAANAGDAEAMCRLAALYEQKAGATVQTEQSDEWYRTETLSWYRKAGGLGNEEAKRWLQQHDR